MTKSHTWGHTKKLLHCTEKSVTIQYILLLEYDVKCTTYYVLDITETIFLNNEMLISLPFHEINQRIDWIYEVSSSHIHCFESIRVKCYFQKLKRKKKRALMMLFPNPIPFLLSKGIVHPSRGKYAGVWSNEHPPQCHWMICISPTKPKAQVLFYLL